MTKRPPPPPPPPPPRIIQMPPKPAATGNNTAKQTNTHPARQRKDLNSEKNSGDQVTDA